MPEPQDHFAGRHWSGRAARAAGLALGIILDVSLSALASAQTQGEQISLPSSPVQQSTQTQAKEERQSGFQFATPLILSAGRDTGFLSGGMNLNDTVTILTGPTFAVMDNTRRMHFSLNYEPEGEIFARYSKLNAVNHSATLSLDYSLTPRTTFATGDSFRSTEDPTRSLPDSVFLLPRGRLHENSAFASLSYRLDQQTTVSVRFDSTFLTTTPPVPNRPTFLDQWSNTGTVSVRRTIGRAHRLTASYSHMSLHPLEQRVDSSGPVISSIGAVNSADLSYRYAPNRDWVVELTGGTVRTRQFAYTAGADVGRRFGRMWAFAGYQRYLGLSGGLASTGGASPIGGVGPLTGIAPGNLQFANGLLPGALYQVVSLGFTGNLTKRIGLDLHGLGARDESGVLGPRVRTLVGHFRLSYKLSDRVVAFVSADAYHQSLNPLLDSRLSRKRYFGGLEFILSRPTEARRAPQGASDVESAREPDSMHSATDQDLPPAGAIPQEER